MQVKLHVHFISYLHQLDSGILTESCFLRWALGKLVSILGISLLPSLPVQISHHGCLLTQNKLTTVQQSSCYSQFLGPWRNFQLFFFLGSTLGIFSSSVKSRQSKGITAVLGPSRIGEIHFSYLKTK